MHEVLVVGLGAVGSLYSLILKRSGLARVTAVARSNYDVVQSAGITFKSKKYGNHSAWRPDRLFSSVSEAADVPYSFVFVTTKAIPELKKTSDLLAPFLESSYPHPQPTYVLLQNGINVEKDLYVTLKSKGGEEPKVVSTALWVGTNLLEPNVVEHNDFVWAFVKIAFQTSLFIVTQDRMFFGMYKPGGSYTKSYYTPTESKILQELNEALSAGGTTTNMPDNIQAVKFTKNFWNLSMAATCTLTGYTLPSIFRAPPGEGESYEPYVSPVTKNLIDEYTLPLLEAILREALEVGRALGYEDSPDGLPSSAVTTTIQNTGRLHVLPTSVHVPSMLLDARLGRPIEVEVIVGEIVRMARERGVSIPRIETLYGLLLVVQNQLLRKNGAS